MAEPTPAGSGGILSFFARHRTAANLVMIIMLLAGGIGLARMNTQFFPNFGIDMVVTTVQWPGASAADVDANIVQPIDREVRFLDSVKRVVSTSREGSASVLVEFVPGTDMQSALANVETAVAQVTTLPEDSETPEIRRIVRYDTIARLLLSGPVGEAELKRIAKRIRDRLIQRGIDKVDLFGARDEEILVAVDPESLRALDLTAGDVAARIGAASQDLPSGDTGGTVEKQIRSIGLKETAEGVAGIEVVSRASGDKVAVGDIARVSESFDDDGNTAWYRGNRAISLHVQRATSADALATAKILHDTLDELRSDLPPGVTLTVFDEAASLIESRIQLLVNNGIGGLVIVVLVLFVFLNTRVALWVAAGIPTALFGAMGVMLLTGQSINMVSLFGMILVLGIVVDDAIVVGEHAEMQRGRGLDGLSAAELGAQRMAAPVLASILTTIAAFLPMFVIGDIIGTIIRAIPMVVVAALVCSMIECFFVLPGHLRHALAGNPATMLPVRAKFNRAFDAFRDGWFRRLVRLGLAQRYTTLALALALLVASVGLIAGGRVGFTFFPTPEVDVVYGNMKLVPGSSREAVRDGLLKIEAAAYEAAAELSPDRPLIHTSAAFVGTHLGADGPGGVAQGQTYGSVFLQLIPSEERDIRTPQFVAAWKRHLPPVADMESLTFPPVGAGPPGREIDIRLFDGEPAVLKRAADEVLALVQSFPGVSDLEDSLPYGKQELVIRLTPAGRALGFTTQSVGRQVRDAFEGAIAKRFARDDEEVKVRVRLDADALANRPLEDVYLRGPTGAEVPLGEVVSTESQRGFATIRREDGFREVAVAGEIDETATTSQALLTALEPGIAQIAKKFGLQYRFAGKAEEQAQTFGDMKIGAITGLALIYIVLAWVFGSYWLPLAVMAIIPFGMIGVSLGHFLLGYDLTFLSMVGMLGLSGILVNDSIVLISTIHRRRQSGMALLDAIEQGTCERLRAVLLTSLTTIGGLTPLMFETSTQAQFLIPMAITIVFGLGIATLLVLVLVPALVAVGADIGRLAAAVTGRSRPAEPPPATPTPRVRPT
ncbi:MAG: efflux RND transporter permease subunit [Alphaproteobacteria bacterium]|nr:efflux RND transporter permease subunit [Alphaproteobacteria bacterium]MCB9930778.1 efflux RND transporter permease subunit [Alphaproteobacteria bacterium]